MMWFKKVLITIVYLMLIYLGLYYFKLHPVMILIPAIIFSKKISQHIIFGWLYSLLKQ